MSINIINISYLFNLEMNLSDYGIFANFIEKG